jgi:hypothetical protein
MADSTIKPDSGNDLVLQNNGGSKKIEITNSGNIEVTGAVDLQGNELILDADGDSSITSDTDDQVDVKIAGTDKFSVDANGIRLGPKAGSSTSHNVPYKITVGPYNWSQSNDEISEITMGASSTGSDDGEIKFYTAQNVDSGGTLTERLHIESGGDVKVKTGNLVIGTAGKGIDFSAQTAGSGMLSSYSDAELLHHYEVGVHEVTAYLYNASGNGTYPISSSYNTLAYVRVGDAVHIGGMIIQNGAYSGNDGPIILSLPFPVKSTGEDSAFWVGSCIGFYVNMAGGDYMNCHARAGTSEFGIIGTDDNNPYYSISGSHTNSNSRFAFGLTYLTT